MGKGEVVVDTNVPLVANGKAEQADLAWEGRHKACPYRGLRGGRRMGSGRACAGRQQDMHWLRAGAAVLTGGGAARSFGRVYMFAYVLICI